MSETKGVNIVENGYESAEVCRRCGGACCRSNGCSLSPEDMLRELAAYREGEIGESVTEEWLRQSDCAIDSFTGRNGPCYFLRMRHKCFTFIGVDAMGECVALTEQGCSLPYGRRPKGGRFLEGCPDGHCRQHYTREQMEEDWRPYQQLLGTIWNRWHDRLEQEGVFDRCEEAYMCYQREKRQREGGGKS